uniref:BPL/LPL catalytic domain-containing protein n=1 Tax=Quercus lobata TaxID=97700 RepID=A0A7N2RB15_QUELO
MSLKDSLRFLTLRNSIHSLILSPRKLTFPYKLSFSPLSAMDSNSSSTLVLCGKSTAENEIAVSLKSNKTLKLPGDSEVSVLLKSELEENSFRIDSYMASLSTSQFGRFLIWSPRLPSTHDVVSHNFGELPIGTVCVADVQFKGRGRSKNVWESPMGCLMFSFTTQMEDGRVVPLVQYVVSLAITEAIKDVCDKNGLPCIDVKIKWPNDLYLNGLKVGGILCTSTYRSKKFNVSAGIGLNVDNEKPTTCLNAALKELSVVAYQLSREEILAAFFEKFEKFNDLFINQGFQTLEELYYKTWLHRLLNKEQKREAFLGVSKQIPILKEVITGLKVNIGKSEIVPMGVIGSLNTLSSVLSCNVVEVGALELVEVLRDVECGRILGKVLRVSLVMCYNVVGEGFHIRFWYDLWCGQIPLKDLYPDLFSRAMGKEASIFELITISSNGGSRSWNIQFHKGLDDWEEERVFSFYEHVYSKMPRGEGIDSLFWKSTPNGVFDVHSFYNSLSTPPTFPFPWKCIWSIMFAVGDVMQRTAVSLLFAWENFPGGQRVIVQEKNEDQMVENVVTIQGLTSSGYLLAIGEDNQMYELHPDGNSLDFFKGLIRRKLD